MYKKLQNELTQTNDNLEEKVKELDSKLFNITLSKEEYEKEFEKIKMQNFYLIEENEQLKKDMNSLRNHISVLENQNASVI